MTPTATRRSVVDPESGFIFAPSCFGTLAEGKALGTADLDDLSLLHDIVRKKDTNLEQFAQARKTGSSIGKRKLKQVQQRAEDALLDLLRQWDDQEIAERALRKDATTVMKRAWRDVFLAGVRASGTAPSGLKGQEDPLVLLGPGDDKWLRSAVRHEMGFFNGLLDAIVTSDYVMPLERRIKMYTRALESFYDSARIIGLPNNTIIHWVTRGDARTCPSCVFLADHSPYTTANLPTTPRSGAQLCLCLTSDRTLVYTRRGDIPLHNVHVGDDVWTHRGRWRRVRSKRLNRSVVAHRYAVLVGPHGDLTGVTSDHPVWTRLGWVTAEEAARANLHVLPALWTRERAESVCPLPALCDDGGVEVASARGSVPHLPTLPEGEGGHVSAFMLPVCTQGGRAPAAHAVYGPDRSPLPSAWMGRSLRGPVLGWGPDPSCLPVPVAMGAEEWANPRGVGDTPQEWGSVRRPSVELGVQAFRRPSQRPPGGSGSWRRALLGRGGSGQPELVGRADAPESLPALWAGVPRNEKCGQKPSQEVLLDGVLRCGADTSHGTDVPGLWPDLHAPNVRASEVTERRFLLSDLLRRAAAQGVEDPAVRLLRAEVSAPGVGLAEVAEVRVGQVLLLAGVLPPGSPLYDLEVEDDHSFVAGGLIVHNSNDRCWLYIRRVPPREAKKVEDAARYTRGGFIKKLRKIKRVGHP